jgi:hypothetical protein
VSNLITYINNGEVASEIRAKLNYVIGVVNAGMKLDLIIPVTELPLLNLAEAHKVYLLADPATENRFLLYTLNEVNGTRSWLLLGAMNITFSGYATTDELQALLQALTGVLDNKVEKEPGKGLSTLDFDNEQRDRLTSAIQGATFDGTPIAVENNILKILSPPKKHYVLYPGDNKKYYVAQLPDGKWWTLDDHASPVYAGGAPIAPWSDGYSAQFNGADGYSGQIVLPEAIGLLLPLGWALPDWTDYIALVEACGGSDAVTQSNADVFNALTAAAHFSGYYWCAGENAEMTQYFAAFATPAMITVGGPERANLPVFNPCKLRFLINDPAVVLEEGQSIERGELLTLLEDYRLKDDTIPANQIEGLQEAIAGEISLLSHLSAENIDLSEQCNGERLVFTLPPATAFSLLLLNGQVLFRDINYTLNENHTEITLLRPDSAAPKPGDILIALNLKITQ